MAQENFISLKLTQEEIAQINGAITTLNNVLKPYLIALTNEERHSLTKMADKTVPFVTKSLDYLQTNSEFAPPYINIDEMKIDMDAVNLLKSFNPLGQLLSGLDDTIMLSGSEAYNTALTFYNSIKQTAKMNIPGAKVIYDDLKARFPSRHISAPSE